MTTRANDAADDAHDELLHSSEQYDARREIIWLTVFGFVLIVVAGAATWLSRWHSVEFDRVGLVADRLISVEYQCRAESRIEVDEFDDRVEILFTERPPSDDCDAIYVRCVELFGPLGDRRVINVGTGEEAIVESVTEVSCADGDG